jgi:hypothetical protein
MSHHVIEFHEKCKSCNGTGLYVGMAERDGFAVVCSTCEGTGKHFQKIEYDDFEKRASRSNVVHVLEVNPGIGVGTGNGHKLTDFGGMPYKDWLKNGKFPPKSEMRKYVCPAWWYQSANYKLKPDWKECCGCGSFSDCDHFSHKQKCWERFDKEYK